MNIPFQNVSQIKSGLSKKKIYRSIKNNFGKIIIDFSKDEDEMHNFFFIYNILKKIDVTIPNIYEVNLKNKIVVMEDFGDNAFDKIYQKEGLYNLLKLAIENLIIIENSISKDDLASLKKYTFTELIEEISEFVDYYIPFKKITKFPVKLFYKTWERVYKDEKFIFDSFVHKDFEFINLIFINKNSLQYKCGIIDFQSAFLGFKGWDLFSILENPRLEFTREYNHKLIKYFYENINFAYDFDTFLNQYYTLNLARQTRLLGRWVKIFNEGNNKYLSYINVTENRIISILDDIKDDRLKKFYENNLLN